jgi:hypothetical protein
MQSGTGPRPFDVTTGFLIELDARAWLDWLGLPVTGAVRSFETDVATVLAEVDKVLHVDGPSPWLAHFELQASHDPKLPLRMLQYHALLLSRHELPVETTVILLRSQADGTELTGLFEQQGAVGSRTIAFNYRVIRLWERPIAELLGGGLGVLPLAPLAAVSYDQLPDLLNLLDERFVRETDHGTAEDLRSATTLLLGLRYNQEQIRGVVRRMSWLRESSVYQAIAAEEQAVGRVAEARRLVLKLGAERLGAPTSDVQERVEQFTDVDELERLLSRLFTATTWQELLAPPSEI